MPVQGSSRRLARVAFSIAFATVGSTAAAAAPADAARFALGGCGDGRTVAPAYDDLNADRVTRCARLRVPLDHGGRIPGQLRLSVRALVPRGRPVAGTPVVHLSGGPGEAATRFLDQAGEGLGEALGRRLLVTFDQRGTRDSGALRCPSLQRSGDSDARFDAAVAACARRLGPRRALYGTAASVEDLEALRIALRAPKLILWGTSYGTKLALDYAARHPDGVARLVLDSVVPPAGVDPFMRSSFAAIPRVLRALCAGGACPFTADPAGDLATLVQRMRASGPLRGRWVDHRGRARSIALAPERLLDLLVDGDMDPFARLAFPAAVRAAVDGDLAPLARAVAPPRFGSRGGVSDYAALFLATRCADGPHPWPAATPADQRAAAAAAALAALPPAALAPFDAATVRED
ncbi:alpha/beta fold hydrolase, partial [Conexibacter stalactiti]